MSDDSILLTRRNIIAISAMAGGISVAGPALAFPKLGKLGGAIKDLAKAESISDGDLKLQFDAVSADSDRQNPVASLDSPYGQRIAKLSDNLKTHDGLNLDIKAYLVSDVNAFAMGNGTIRIFAGLMDRFDDDEVRYVIGHEMGHVKSGHSKERMQTALRASALQKGLGSVGGGVGKIASGELGNLFTKVVTAQHSQKNEKEADDYAVAMMQAKGWNAQASVTALDKLAALSGGNDSGLPWLATHPTPAVRARRIRGQLNMG